MKYVFAGILLLLVGIATVASQKDSRLPAETTVREFTSAYNEKNIDKVLSLYAADAVMVSEAGVAEGPAAIRGRVGHWQQVAPGEL